jgi:GGDEF domain-containing protein
VGAAIAERLVSALEAPIVVNDQALYVGTSVGIATSPFDASDVESLLRAADRAMYLSKRAGGGFLRAAA